MLGGLKRAGYHVVLSIDRPAPDDLLVIWNRYGEFDQAATRFEKWGAAVIVAENGYVGARDNDNGKPVSATGEALYAMALNRHNGAGRWHVGSPGRAAAQGIELKPWRTGSADGHVLLLAQRGIGLPPVASPGDWIERTQRRLAKVAKRPIRVRGHPGNEAPRKPLARDLENCWAAATWASSAGIRALVAGTPIYSDWAGWIAAPAARQAYEQIEEPLCDDAAREATIERIAWAQWTVSEISSGEPFARLIELHMNEAAAA
jgi:hypothetical protein